VLVLRGVLGFRGAELQRLVAIRYCHVRIDLLAELVESALGREERLLDEVFGVLRGAKEPVAVQLKLMP
jgi:hypothetical protein